MPVRSLIRAVVPHRSSAGAGLCALCAAACSLLHPAPAPAPAPPPTAAPQPAPVPAPALEAAVVATPSDPANGADLAARRLLAYHERVRQMSTVDVAVEVTRLGALVSSPDSRASPDDVLALALALVQQHNPGDLARASSLLEPLAQDVSPPSPWQPLARLLAARIAEQRRLEEQLDRLTAQRRDTQRAIQQLTEKLEALKAIERSMTTHPPTPPPAAGPGSSPSTEPPPAPKTP
jgi:hypothetical protein